MGIYYGGNPLRYLRTTIYLISVYILVWRITFPYMTRYLIRLLSSAGTSGRAGYGDDGGDTHEAHGGRALTERDQAQPHTGPGLSTLPFRPNVHKMSLTTGCN